jgi:hypothetical protein
MIVVIKEKEQEKNSTTFKCLWKEKEITIKLLESDKTEIDCLKYLLKIEEEIKNIKK